jgi:glycosyltransferase involved in cell wall biosynthesis
MEADAIRTLIPGSRVAVIPNGVNVPVEQPEPACGAEPYLLFMGRLHRYKRVERIIRAFAAAVGEHGAQMPQGSAVVGRERSGRRGTLRDELLGGRWALFVAGDGDADYRRELERFAADSGVGDCVRFVGHVSGEEKAWLLAEAEGLVLASYSENFGMSVAEALAHGTPCLVTKTAPWEGLERERCGLWVDDSEEALTEGMRRLMALSPAERRAMGMRGREWMQRDFSWDNVARRMLTLYEELAGETAERSAAGG